MLSRALELKERTGLDVSIVNARSVKPLDSEFLKTIVDNSKPIVTLEENSSIGGFGALCCTYFASKGQTVKILTLGACDKFVCHKTIEEQLDDSGFSQQRLEQKIKEFIG